MNAVCSVLRTSLPGLAGSRSVTVCYWLCLSLHILILPSQILTGKTKMKGRIFAAEIAAEISWHLIAVPFNSTSQATATWLLKNLIC